VTGAESGRRAELAANLAAVRARIDAACAAAGRDPGELTLIAVTKTHPATDVLALVELGVRDIGENRDQEAAPKAAQVAAALPARAPAAPAAPAAPTAPAAPAAPAARAAPAAPEAPSGSIARTGPIEAAESANDPVRWHFIGQLQTNKAHSVARYAQVVHSVDRVRLVRALGGAATAAGRELSCLVQVSLDDDPARGGVPAARLAEVAAAIEAEPGLRLGGIMAVAPLGTDPAAAFAPLRELSATVRSVNASAFIISAGMSGDLDAAVANGATHLRIGTALLGNRRPPVR
jgi:PLP dependent protein